VGARGEIMGGRTTTVSASAAPRLVAAQEEEMDEQDEGRNSPRPNLSNGDSAQIARPDAQTPIRPLSAFAVPATPPPTYTFNTSGPSPLSGIDVGMAASHTHVCLTVRDTFACYSKGGTLTGLGNGFGPQPVLAKTFFESGGISPSISLPAAESPAKNNGFVKDGRILFDPITLRFYVVFQTREDAARLLIAVSKSEDPNDGWWTYAEPIGIGSQFGQDYQKIGINGQFLLVSNRQQDRKTKVFSTFNWMFTLAELTNGQKFSKLGWTTGTDDGMTPCLHQTFTTDAYYLTEETTGGTVWIVRGGIIFRRSFTFKNGVGAPPDGEQFGSNTMVENTVGANPGNAEYRNGKIVWVSALGIVKTEFPGGFKSPGVVRGVVRIGRVDVSNFSPLNATSPSLEIDEIVPLNDQGDALTPWPNGLFHRAHPAVATNANGDVVIGSLKTNGTILPAQSASVWLSGQPDISAGAVIAKSSGPLGSIHMAGASSDPSTAGVYLAQQLGVPGGSTIQVTKMLGATLPDILTTNMSAVVPTGGIRQGVFFTIMVTVTNQGDAIMPASPADLYLSVSPVISPLAIKLTSFKVPALAVDETKVLPVYVYISPDLGTLQGDWYIGAVLSSDHVADEQSYKNDMNPTLAANRGNLMITFPTSFADGGFELPVGLKGPWEFKFNNPLGQGGIAQQGGAYAGAQFAWLYNNNCKA
jgi:hypothetical protein